MKVGMPARITRIGDAVVDRNVWYMNDSDNFNARVSGRVDIGTLVHAEMSTTPTRLRSDYVSATLASAGENPGIRRVALWIRPDDGDEDSAVLLNAMRTDADVPAPQFLHTFVFDSTAFPNGVYELFFVAEDSRGILSIPDFGGVGEQISDADELNGYPFGLHITIDN